MKYDWQPIRELFALLGLLFLGAGWFLAAREPSLSPLAFMETSLVLVILAEAYARDA